MLHGVERTLHLLAGQVDRQQPPAVARDGLHILAAWAKSKLKVSTLHHQLRVRKISMWHLRERGRMVGRGKGVLLSTLCILESAVVPTAIGTLRRAAALTMW